MRNESGSIEETSKGIANVFEKFYKDSYTCKNDDKKTRRTMKQDLKALGGEGV